MSEEASNLAKRGPNLFRVVMPMVRLMRSGEMTWAEREQISEAIQECHRCWQQMGDECNLIAQRSCAGAAPAFSEIGQYTNPVKGLKGYG